MSAAAVRTRDAVLRAVADAAAAGAPCPTNRALAAALRVDESAVAAAFRDLEAAGALRRRSDRNGKRVAVEILGDDGSVAARTARKAANRARGGADRTAEAAEAAILATLRGAARTRRACPTNQEFAAALGVSAWVVSQALVALVDGGALRVIPPRGTRVQAVLLGPDGEECGRTARRHPRSSAPPRAPVIAADGGAARAGTRETCLRCGQPFVSPDRRRVRVCGDCKNTDDWRAGGAGEAYPVEVARGRVFT